MSVTLLALDTSAEQCSVALVDASGTHLIQSERPRKHADEVLGMIDGLLQTRNLTLDALDAIAMVVGPGSFTGLRIGAAVVQGLAFGADLSVVAVSSLASMARAAVAVKGPSRYIICCLHAREDEYYLGMYSDTGSGTPVATVSDGLMSSADIRRLVNELPAEAQQQWLAVGSGWQQTALTELHASAKAVLPELVGDAGTAAQIALAVPGEEWLDASAALPVYLKDEMDYRKL